MTSNQPSQALLKYCILCVDDDYIRLGLRAAPLEDEGYSVTAVSCLFMALEYDVSQFHLAILDFDLPALNGFQLLLRLRTTHASFPIVLLSGMSAAVVSSTPNLPAQHSEAKTIVLVHGDWADGSAWRGV
jgi:CheY-like chemotaxis protein